MIIMYEREILEIYKYCGITSFPVDCQKIADKIGYQIRTYQETATTHEELVEMKKVSGDAYVVRKNKTIYMNDQVHERRKLFTLAHELGHIILLSDDEMLANDFASQVLAPRPVVFAENLRTADEISSFFGLSVSAANNVIFEIKFRSHPFFPKQSELDLLEYLGYRDKVPSLFIHAVHPDTGKRMPLMFDILQQPPKVPTKEEEQLKKKKIRSQKGKIQRLQKKLVETRDEKEWYAAKNRLAKEQMRLDMLLGISLEDY